MIEVRTTEHIKLYHDRVHLLYVDQNGPTLQETEAQENHEILLCDKRKQEY